jgi:SAM-dependent methyltransferase
VSGGADASVLSPALVKAIELFRPGVDYLAEETEDGYIDLLGSADPIDSRPSHQIVRKKNFPRIYERIWRPVVSRAFLGLFGMGSRKERRIMLEMLKVSHGDCVLDVGCGPGNYTRDLAAVSESGLVVGVDASDAMLAAGAKQGGHSNLAYLRADACVLPFVDGGFDVVCCVGTIHMTKSPMAALAEMTRVLAPGGRIAFLTTCNKAGVPSRVRNGITMFARDEIPDALAAHDLVGIEQRIVARGQFISAVRP